MADDDAGVVTMHVWRVPAHRVPGALRAIGTDRHRLRALPGVRFAKLLGTSATFSARRADLTRWVMLASCASPGAARAVDESRVVHGWRGRAHETWQVLLCPLLSRGRWSRVEPFGSPSHARWDGPVAAITRARLAPAQAVAFWRAVPYVTADLWQQRELGLAFGIGEAPLGVQGTFSVWRNAEAMRAFAHGGAAHRRAVRETARRGWYAEELFARFAVLQASGSVDGRDPLRFA